MLHIAMQAGVPVIKAYALLRDKYLPRKVGKFLSGKGWNLEKEKKPVVFCRTH